ncbi:unnamed protein product [Phytomonas sp. EM1]|nr:unnamed protein product [Phytomonas sp. EM1]|eukprot:CCW62810.1 unnamed protein product [Phytomonas sp. isolate EM1]
MPKERLRAFDARKAVVALAKAHGGTINGGHTLCATPCRALRGLLFPSLSVGGITRHRLYHWARCLFGEDKAIGMKAHARTSQVELMPRDSLLTSRWAWTFREETGVRCDVQHARQGPHYEANSFVKGEAGSVSVVGGGILPLGFPPVPHVCGVHEHGVSLRY